MFNLRESINDSGFVGLNNTNKVVAKLERLSKSVFRRTAVTDGFPTIERLVLSTKKSDINSCVIRYVIVVKKKNERPMVDP